MGFSKILVIYDCFSNKYDFTQSTRGVMGGGLEQHRSEHLRDFITIANTANATDFGDYWQDLGYRRCRK